MSEYGIWSQDKDAVVPHSEGGGCSLAGSAGRSTTLVSISTWFMGWLLLFSFTSAWSAERQTLRGHVPDAVTRLTPTERLPATNRLRLAIGLPLRNQAALAGLLQQL